MDTSPEKDFFDLENLDESVEVEFKAAQGRDGQGELPKSFWESYAAMANTQGGIIALGIKETKTGVEMIGVPDHQKVRQDLFNQANNAEKVSCNLLSDERVVTRDLQGKKILVIDIPRADRRSRPVHLGRNPLREALHGGTSDCRNRNLQKMFQLVGLGEQSGFGFPKIHSNWAAQHWRAPDVEERVETDQVILALRMMSLMPEESVSFLQSSLGDRFNDLSELERIALVTAHAEDCVTHARLAELTKEHPRDLTHSLHTLVGDHFLESEGKGTGTFYYLPGAHPIENSGAKEIFGYKMRKTPKENGESDSGHKQENSGHSPKNSGHSSTQNQEKLENPHLDQHVEKLRKIAAPVAEVPRAAKEIVEATILKLCAGRFLQLVELGELLKRDPDTLRKSYINPMVKAAKLCPEHVNIKNHPKQRYTAVSQTNNKGESS